jgi:hypothetical protein
MTPPLFFTLLGLWLFLAVIIGAATPNRLWVVVIGVIPPLVYWATLPLTYAGDSALSSLLPSVAGVGLALVAAWIALWATASWTRKAIQTRRLPLH